MASTDATAYPIKNAAWRVTFPILDADGDLVTGASGLDSEVSKDGGTFADCTNEATEIATNSGVYYLDLTSTEMNADTVAIIVKTSTSGAKTTTIVVYPITLSAAKLGVNVVNFGGTAGTFSGGRPEVNTTHAAGTAWGSGAITSGAFATGAITATAIAADAIGASELAADAATEIGTAVWASATRVLTANTNLSIPTAADIRSAVGLASANLDTQLDALPTAAENRAEIDSNSTQLAAIVADTNELQTDWANGGRLDLILDARASQTSVDDLPTNSELSTALAAADDAVLAAIAALNNLSSAQAASAVLTTQMTESYNADGTAPTLAQAVFLILQMLTEKSVSSTTLTVKKLDGSTTAATFTLDSATEPTSITRAS